jgi:hypothetical protein
MALFTDDSDALACARQDHGSRCAAGAAADHHEIDGELDPGLLERFK